MTGLPRLPSLRGIEAFVAAAETLSFPASAERLHVTASAVSHRIHTLEEEIGVRLFARRGRALMLTHAGEAYWQRVTPILNDLQKATDAVHGARESELVRLASFQMFYSDWLAPRLTRFLALHPAAEFELLTLRRRCSTHPDITFRIFSDPAQQIDGEVLMQWNVVPMCRPELVEAHDLRTPADLLKVRRIEWSSSLDAWPAWFEAAGVGVNAANSGPQSAFVVDTPALAHELIEFGAGVALVCDCFMARYVNLGLVCPFDIRCPYPGGVFVNPATELERPIVKAFRSWLVQEVDEMSFEPPLLGASVGLVARP